MITCSKTFGPYPFAHRQHKHDGHCALIHGHNWNFGITFEATELDENGFVIDFGKMKPIKDMLADLFDHTFCVNVDDPAMATLEELENKKLAKIVIVPNGSAEGLAVFVQEVLAPIVTEMSKGRVQIRSVTVFEDNKNQATYAV